MNTIIKWDYTRLIITTTPDVMDHNYYKNLRPLLLKFYEEKKFTNNILLDLSNVSFYGGDWTLAIIEDLTLILREDGFIDILCKRESFDLYYESFLIDFRKNSFYPEIRVRASEE